MLAPDRNNELAALERLRADEVALDVQIEEARRDAQRTAAEAAAAAQRERLLASELLQAEVAALRADVERRCAAIAGDAVAEAERRVAAVASSAASRRAAAVARVVSAVAGAEDVAP